MTKKARDMGESQPTGTPEDQTAKSNAASPSPETGELRRGRRAAPWTDAHDWVGLATGVDPEAHSLYVKLKMHLNQERGDTMVWPGKIPLAEMMKFAKVDTLDKYIDQLERIGAIDVERLGQPARSFYTLNDLPADGYCLESGYPVSQPGRPGNAGQCKTHHKAGDEPCQTAPYAGPMTIKEWYEQHAGNIEMRRDAAKAKREAQRAKAKKPQVTPDTRSTGYQGEIEQTDLSDTRATGYLDTPSSGCLDTPSTGAEQRRSKQLRKEQDGGHAAPQTPLRPQEPTTSSPGTDPLPATYVRPPQHQDLQGDNRPRTRENADETPAFIAVELPLEPDSDDNGVDRHPAMIRQHRVEPPDWAAGALSVEGAPDGVDTMSDGFQRASETLVVGNDRRSVNN